MDNLKKKNILSSLTILFFFIFFQFLSDGLCTQNTPPSIQTDFVFETDAFKYLGSNEKSGIREHIARIVARSCTSCFGFLEWKALVDSPSLPPETPKFVIRMVGDLNSKISLKYEAEINGKQVSFVNISNDLLYHIWDDPPTHDPQRLQCDIEEKIEKKFKNEQVLINLHNEFLSFIPLTHQVRVDHNACRLIVPIKWQDLKARAGSVLKVEFTAKYQKLPDGDTIALRDGTMELQLEGKAYYSQEYDKNLAGCLILVFTYPPERFEDWNDEIPNILKPGNIEKMHVFMDKYIKNIFSEDNEGTQ